MQTHTLVTPGHILWQLKKQYSGPRRYIQTRPRCKSDGRPSDINDISVVSKISVHYSNCFIKAEVQVHDLINTSGSYSFSKGYITDTETNSCPYKVEEYWSKDMGLWNSMTFVISVK